MEPSPEGIVSALLKGDYRALVQAALVFAVIHYGAYLVTFLRKKWLELVAMGRESANSVSFLSKTSIDDRLFDLMEKAAEGLMVLEPGLADAAADGRLTQDELTKAAEKVLDAMRKKAGLPDMTSFALALLGNAKEVESDGTPSPKLKDKLRQVIEADLPVVMSRAGHRVGERRLERAIKARGALQPPPQLPQQPAA